MNSVNNALNLLGVKTYKPLNFAASFPAVGNTPAGFAVTTGTGTQPVYLDYTDDIMLASVSQAELIISQFITVIGSFAFEQGPTDQAMKTADGDTVYVDSMTVGVSNAYAFVGYGGPYWVDTNGTVTAPSSSSAVGLALSDVALGIGFFNQNISAISHDTSVGDADSSYFALKVTAGSASLVGLSGILTATLDNVLVAVNNVSNSLNLAGTEPYKPLNFTASFPAVGSTPAGFAVATGTGTPAVYLDYTDDIFLASVSNAELIVSQFITIFGSFAFEQGPSDQAMKTADGDTVYVDSMTIGVSNGYAFVGYGGPYWTDNNGVISQPGNAGSAVGLALSDVALGIGFFNQNISAISHDTSALDADSSYFALKLTAGSASLVGLSGILTATLDNVLVEVNQVSNAFNLAGTEPYKPLNFTASFPAVGNTPAGFAVDTGTGTNPVYLDYTDDILLASVSNAELIVGNFITVFGSFAFEEGPQDQQMQTADGNTVYVDSMTIGVSNGYAFVGYGGPYWTDTNGVISQPGNAGSAVGLEISDVALGIGFFNQNISSISKDTDSIDADSSYFAMKLTAGSASLVGLSGILTATLQNVLVEVNQVSNSFNLAGTKPYKPLNFAASFPSTTTDGVTSPVGFAVDTGTGTSKTP